MGFVHLAVILGCATLIFGQTDPRNCTEIQTIQNFDSDKFTGLWYEITARMNLYGEEGECSTIHYSRLDNNTFEIKNRVCNLRNQVTILGNLEPINDNKGQFNISYPVISSVKLPYWVYATDYTSYSVIGRCIENYLYFAVYARSPKLEGANKDTVSNIVKNITGEDMDKIGYSKQENCCYDANSATSLGFSLALPIFTVFIRFF